MYLASEVQDERSSTPDPGQKLATKVSKSLACIASVSVEQRAKKKRGFRHFARVKSGARAKIRRTGWGRVRKEPLAAKHCDFQILRLPANGARDWLG